MDEGINIYDTCSYSDVEEHITKIQPNYNSPLFSRIFLFEINNKIDEITLSSWHSLR